MAEWKIDPPVLGLVATPDGLEMAVVAQTGFHPPVAPKGSKIGQDPSKTTWPGIFPVLSHPHFMHYNNKQINYIVYMLPDVRLKWI